MSNMFAALADPLPKKTVKVTSAPAVSVSRNTNNNNNNNNSNKKRNDGNAKRNDEGKGRRRNNNRKGDDKDRQSRGGRGSNRTEKRGGSGRGNWGSDSDAMKKEPQQEVAGSDNAEGNATTEESKVEPEVNTLTLAEYKAKMAGIKVEELKTVRELDSKDDKFNNVVVKKDMSSDSQFHNKNKISKQKKTKAIIETGVFYNDTNQDNVDRSNKRGGRRGGRNGKNKNNNTSNSPKLNADDFPSL